MVAQDGVEHKELSHGQHFTYLIQLAKELVIMKSYLLLSLDSRYQSNTLLCKGNNVGLLLSLNCQEKVEASCVLLGPQANESLHGTVPNREK